MAFELKYVNYGPLSRAVGHYEYGDRYRDEISNTIRRTAEMCDCLQCFFCIHSMGGGTYFKFFVRFTFG